MGRSSEIAVALAMASLVLAGCAFGNVTIHGPDSEDVATGSHRGEGREVVLVRPFANRRRQERCGMKKNGYNMDTASVLCAGEPEETIANLVARELRAVGFKVSSDPRMASRSAIVLQGALDRCSSSPR